MSANDPGPAQQDRIEQNIKRAVGKRALSEISKVVAEERRADAANAWFVRTFLRYGLVFMVIASLLVARLLHLL